MSSKNNCQEEISGRITSVFYLTFFIRAVSSDIIGVISAELLYGRKEEKKKNLSGF